MQHNNLGFRCGCEKLSDEAISRKTDCFTPFAMTVDYVSLRGAKRRSNLRLDE
jgi:hypothetical protein